MTKTIKVLEENGYVEYRVNNDRKLKGCIEIKEDDGSVWVGKPQAIWEDENGNMFANSYRAHEHVRQLENGNYEMFGC